MEEPRRIAFETVKPGSKEKKHKGHTPTHRFTLSLLESDDKTYSEYSYNDLLKTVSKKKANNENGDKDPFGDSNDDADEIMAVAKKFEEKYGPKPGKKKKHQQWEDYVDKGLGYDETDPFIDNDEAYDELVPSSITTQHGGFYINLGELEFRTLSSDDEPFPYDPTKKRKKKKKLKDLIKKERRKKRVIRDEEDDFDDEELLRVQKKSKKLGELSVESFSTSTETVKKIKPTPVAEPKENNNPSVVNNHLLSPTSGTHPPTTPSNDVDLETAKDAQAVAISSSDNEEIEHKNLDMLHEVPKLPENLPSDLEAAIDKLKQAALFSEEGKCKFFTSEVNDMLLSVELKSRELSTGNRSMIYSHLAAHLPCTKETLLKRAKKLRMNQEDSKLHSPMEGLKMAIIDIMPSQKIRYELECQAAAAIEMADKEKGGEKKLENEGEDKKQTRGPRRKFMWTTEIRSLLCEVVKVKLKCFQVMKARTQTVEEYLRQFLELEIKELWPPGWINSRILMRESKSVYAHLSKVKKTVLPPKKTLQSSSQMNSGALPITSVTNPPISLVNSEPMPLTSEASTILSTMKNTSLSKISETAALPSISKLIQQTKVSSFPAVPSTSNSNMVAAPPTVNKTSDIMIVHKSNAGHAAPGIHPPGKAPSMSIEALHAKSDNPGPKISVGKTGSVTDLITSVMTSLHPSAPVKTTAKVKNELPFEATKPSTFPKPERSRTSSLSSVSPSATSHTVKEQLVSKESSAIDVLDQIINASLGNYKNTIMTDAFSNSSSKLVDNALMSLVSTQHKTVSQANLTPTIPPRTSLPTMPSPSQRVSPAISIVKASSSNQLSPNNTKHTIMSPNLIDTPKSVLQTPPESIYKSFEKYLNDNSQTQAISVTPVEKNQPVAVTSSQMPSSKLQVDANAPYRSSYEFREAFLNSLNSNSCDPSFQSVMKSPTKPATVKAPDSNLTPSGFMKKQDFFSQNRAVSLLNNNKMKPNDNIPKSVTMYSPSSSNIPRSSPQAMERMVISTAHKPYSHCSTHVDVTPQVETIYTNAAESLASIVNLAVEKPKKSPGSNQRPSKSVIQSPNNYIQDGLASSLLQHHVSFSSDKWQEKLQSAGANYTKASPPKSEHYNVGKYPVHVKHDGEINRTSPIAVSNNMVPGGWMPQKRSDLPSSYAAPVVNKCTIPNLNNDAMVTTFRHPSPSNPGLPKSKSPVLSTQVSPSYGKYQTPHNIKSYPHISQPSSAMQTNPMLLQQGSVYQTSPTSSSMSTSMSLPQHQHVDNANFIPATSVYNQMQNFNQQKSPHRHMQQ